MCSTRLEVAYLIDKVLLSLEDGEWHDLNDISGRVQLTTHKVKKILIFLSDFTFVELDMEGWKARIDLATRKWLQGLHEMEE